MELKEFIKQSIQAIADATSELQDHYSGQGILINPPSAQSGNDVYQPGSSNYTMRLVKNVVFDVAVTVGSEDAVSAGAGIQVFSAKIGGQAEKTDASETVSRVSFEIPITLRPTDDETQNTKIGEEEKRGQDGAMANIPKTKRI